MDSDDEVLIDWRSVPLPKRGEKEFEPDGLEVQKDLLSEAVEAMFRALGFPRGHSVRQHVEAVWIGDRLVVPFPKGNYFRDMGTAGDKGILYLDAVETIYLCERGLLSVVLADDVFTQELAEAVSAERFRLVDTSRLAACDLAELYAISGVDIDEYQVYAYLKRLGYLVRRWTTTETNVAPLPTFTTSWWLYFTRFTSYYKFFVNLPRPQVDDYATKPSPQPQGFAVWKPTPNFRKLDPPLPHYHVVCVLAHDPFPTLDSIHSLAQVSPGVPPRPQKPGRKPRRAPNNPMLAYTQARDSKLRMGHHPTVYAVNSDGIINIVTLGVGDFELLEEPELDEMMPGRFHGIMARN